MESNDISSLVEVTEVIVAVKQLNGLSERMRAASFGFKEADVSHIDSIIDALHELDLHKSKARDTLETESIKCAAVRHRFMQYPDEINRDIHEAVQAARLVNEGSIDKLKLQLEQLSNELEQLEKQANAVDAENNNLGTELKALKSEFDGHFANLNDLLAEKSGQQIALNNVRDAVRRANARMVELEEDTAQLAEQMTEERLDHGNTMRRLQEETKVAERELRDRTEKEHSKRQEFLAAHSELQKSACELEEITQEKQALEHDNALLQVQEQDTRRQHETQQKHKEQLRSNIDTLTVQSKAMAQEHQSQVLEMKKTVEQLDARIQQQAALKETAVSMKSQIKERTEALQVKEESVKKMQDASEALLKAKQDLAARSEELGRMRQEIGDMAGRRAELEDAERAEKEGWLNPAELLENNSVLGYNKRIAELKETVEEERGKRLAVQATSEKLLATIKEFHASDSAQSNEINAQIERLKHEKLALDEEQNRLLAKIKADEARQASLAEALATGREALAEARDSQEAVAEHLLRDTERLRDEKSAREAELAELGPKFDDFQSFYQRSIGEYEALKRSLVAAKNRKAGLEESSRRAGQEIGRLAGEMDGLRRDKERRVAQSNKEMEDMANDRLDTEREIYALGCKLDTVLRENARLTAGIDRLEREMRSMQNSWEWAVPAKARLEQQRGQELLDFQSGRQRDTEMRAKFQEDDKRFLAALTVVFNDAEARKAIVEAVATGLEAELGYLNQFLRTPSDQDDDNGLLPDN